MRRAFTIWTLGGLALLCCPLLVYSQDNQDNKVKLPDFAPKWEVGDWWVVETYTRDLKAAITGVPEEVKPELPGWPKLRGGVPKGFKKSFKYRFEVKKNDAKLSEPDDVEDKKNPEPAENYYLVTCTALNAKPKRVAKLLFAVSDLALGEIEYNLGGKKTTRIKCFGTCVMDCPASLPFGFSFDWPDFVTAGEKREARLKVLDQKLLQKHSQNDKTKLHTITLREDSKKSKGVYSSSQNWLAGEPWWVNFDGYNLKARLVDKKKKK